LLLLSLLHELNLSLEKSESSPSRSSSPQDVCPLSPSWVSFKKFWNVTLLTLHLPWVTLHLPLRSMVMT
jgi:hypothetical protein